VKLQSGTTRTGTNRVTTYCCPAAPFGPPANYTTGQPMNESGAEHLYSFDIEQPAANFGVSVLAATAGSIVDPWVLGSKDENDVQGYAGLPIDVNALTFDSNIDIGAAGVQFPRLKTFYVSVDSRSDPFTNQPLPGSYILNAWVNDVTPPAVRFLTTRVSAGRPVIVAQAVDDQSGVDPASLVIGYDGVLVGASDYDATTGLVLFGLPTAAPKLKVGHTTTQIRASDYQEAKNIDTVGADILPNTAFLSTKIAAVNGPAVDWILPFANQCALKNDQLVVTATSTKKVSSVTFANDGKRVGVDKSGPSGIYAVAWHTAKLKQGKYTLTATVVDAAGRSSVATQTLRVCR
jgi:hypothetical protein